MTARVAAIAGALVAALFLASCGDGEDENDTPPVTQEVPAEPVAPVVVQAEPAAPPAEAPVVAEPAAAAVPAPAPSEPAAHPAETTAATATTPATDVPVAAAPVAAQAPPATPREEQVAPGMPAPVVEAEPGPEALGDPLLLEQIALADAAAGAVIAAERCLGCHGDSPDEPTTTAPSLYNVVMAPVGHDPAFTYSFAMRTLGESGALWSFDRLNAFLTDPQMTLLGTRMGFSGIADETERLQVLAWLRLLADDPVTVGPREPVVGVLIAGLTPVTYFGIQASNGMDTYNAQCASCHGLNLEGRGPDLGNGPALVGAAFEADWFSRPVSDLFDFIRRNKPPAAPRTLSDEQYAAVLAFILRRNGFTAAATIEGWLEPSARVLRTVGFYQY